MADVLHILEIAVPPEKVYKALTEEEGIKSWYTLDAKIEPKIGSTAEFGFYNRASVAKARIERLEPYKQITWRYIDGPGEFLDSVVSFNLTVSSAGIILRFKHTGINGTTEDFFAHVNYSWAYYLTSLKLYLETGKGTPHSG